MPSEPQTFAQKVLAQKAGLDRVSAGQIVDLAPDMVLSHDNTAAIRDIFEKMGGQRVFDPERLAVVIDHAAPAPSTIHAEYHRSAREFVRRQGLKNFFDAGRGVCHQVLVEEGLALPGELVLGADSHTPHAGVMGAFAAGIGRSETASVWALGRLWLMVPQSLKIIVQGRLPQGVCSKDLALMVIKDLSAEGGRYMSLEWHGQAISALSLDQRAVLTNISTEMGAKNSYIPPDDKVFQYLKGRARRAYEPVYPDPDAPYARVVEYQADQVRPMVACPHTVDNVKPLEDVAGTPIQQAFLGTCTNGCLEDLATAARIVKGRKVHPKVRFIVVPASRRVYLDALKAGYIETLVRAGAMVGPAGCGPCLGNHLGVPAAGETVVSSANRNFQGRMGTMDSAIYLAGPAVVAASALAGHLSGPDQL
jgi:3-isopropylmalate/(R)-2-methylmalate dehydratase large subunit